MHARRGANEVEEKRACMHDEEEKTRRPSPRPAARAQPQATATAQPLACSGPPSVGVGARRSELRRVLDRISCVHAQLAGMAAAAPLLPRTTRARMMDAYT